MDWPARVFLSVPQRHLLARGWAIFMLHKTAPVPPGTLDPFEYVPPRRLERRLAALRAAGYRAASLNDLRTETANPNGRFVVSFDDGYASLVEPRQTLDVLARQRVSAIAFLVAGRLGRQNDWDIAKGDVPESLMDVSQVKTWLAAGHRIGSHSLTHANLRRVSPTEAREEIAASKKLLEDTFGVAVTDFCYPYGIYEPRHLELVAEAGYQTGCTVRFGVNGGGARLLELNRLAVLTVWELARKAMHRCVRRLRRG